MFTSHALPIFNHDAMDALVKTTKEIPFLIDDAELIGKFGKYISHFSPVDLDQLSQPMDVNGISQNDFGNCYFVSSIIAICLKDPYFIQKNITLDPNFPNHVVIRLYNINNPDIVHKYILEPTQIHLKNNTGNDYCYTPLYLLEKAYALHRTLTEKIFPANDPEIDQVIFQTLHQVDFQKEDAHESIKSKLTSIYQQRETYPSVTMVDIEKNIRRTEKQFEGRKSYYKHYALTLDTGASGHFYEAFFGFPGMYLIIDPPEKLSHLSACLFNLLKTAELDFATVKPFLKPVFGKYNYDKKNLLWAFSNLSSADRQQLIDQLNVSFLKKNRAHFADHLLDILNNISKLKLGTKKFLLNYAKNAISSPLAYQESELAIFNLLVRFTNDNNFVAATTNNMLGPRYPTKKKGLVPGHAYTVVACHTINHYFFVELINPWRFYVRTYKETVTIKESPFRSLSPKAARQLQPWSLFKPSLRQQGGFLVELKDFIKNFNSIQMVDLPFGTVKKANLALHQLIVNFLKTLLNPDIALATQLPATSLENHPLQQEVEAFFRLKNRLMLDYAACHQVEAMVTLAYYYHAANQKIEYRYWMQEIKHVTKRPTFSKADLVSHLKWHYGADLQSKQDIASLTYTAASRPKLN